MMGLLLLCARALPLHDPPGRSIASETPSTGITATVSGALPTAIGTLPHLVAEDYGYPLRHDTDALSRRCEQAEVPESEAPGAAMTAAGRSRRAPTVDGDRHPLAPGRPRRL